MGRLWQDWRECSRAGQMMAGLFDCGRAGRAGHVKSDGICCRETARKGGMGQLYEVQASC